MTILIASSDEVLTKSIFSSLLDPVITGEMLLDEHDNAASVAKLIKPKGGFLTGSREPHVHVELMDLISHANLVKADFIFLYTESEWFVLHHTDNFVETRVLQTLSGNGWNWNT